jgi:hypothetical protein
MVTNSVVPIAKPPIASAGTASPKWAARVEGAVVWGLVVAADTMPSTYGRPCRFPASP